MVVCVAKFLVFFCAHFDPRTCHVAGVQNVTVVALKLRWHYTSDIFQIRVILPPLISSVSSQEFPFFPSSLPKQDLPEIWILNLQVGSCVAVWEWLYTAVDLTSPKFSSHPGSKRVLSWYVTVTVQPCLQYRSLIFYCKRKVGWLSIVTVLQAGWCGFDSLQEQEMFLFS